MREIRIRKYCDVASVVEVCDGNRVLLVLDRTVMSPTEVESLIGRVVLGVIDGEEYDGGRGKKGG